MLVKKKEQFNQVLRAQNNVTVKNSWPLARIDDCFHVLTGSKWFSTLDLCSGYWQVAMNDTDKPKTTFTTGKGDMSAVSRRRDFSRSHNC